MKAIIKKEIWKISPSKLHRIYRAQRSPYTIYYCFDTRDETFIQKIVDEI